MPDLVTLYAQTAGPAVWQHLEGDSGGAGEVAAVYRRALLWLAAPHEPLTFSLDPAQRGPVVLEAAGPLAVLQTVSPGARVIRAGSRLLFGPALAVELSGVRRWDLPLPTLPPESVLALAEAIRSEMAHGAPRDGLGGVLSADRPHTGWAALAAPFVTALVHGLATCAETAVADGVGGLIGLGPGLTPAGDDFLAGVLAGLQARQDPRSTLLAAAVGPAAIRTTAVSRQLLTWALKGYYGEPVRALFCAAARGEPLAGALAGLLAVGATSGADTAAGIYVGLTLEGS